MLHETIMCLLENRPLGRDAMRAAMQALMGGACQEAEIASFLTALRARGETADQLAAAVDVLRGHMIPLDTGGLQVLDTCGTGGDGHGTVNISTATALVVAACGVPVVKHGNRAVSSSVGSADVLQALGVQVDAEVAFAERCLREVGLAFCFAPRFHPAMRHVAAVRQRLRFRTIFNWLGPLANPARAPFQLLGVGRREMLDLMAQCLAQLGTQRAFLVHGADGLDEVTLSGPTLVRHVERGQVHHREWTPEDFGLPRTDLDRLRVRDVEASAAAIRSILEDQPGPALDVVLANTSAALYTVGRVESLPQGVAVARQAVAQGKARQLLDRLIHLS